MKEEEFKILKRIVETKSFVTEEKHILKKNNEIELKISSVEEKIMIFLVCTVFLSMPYFFILSIFIKSHPIIYATILAAISSLFAIKEIIKLDIKHIEKSFTEEISVMKKFLNGIEMNKDKYLFLECLLREINYEKINKKTFKKIFLKEYKIYKIHLKERNNRLKNLK